MQDLQKVWIVTSSYNEYDQYGDYFERVFFTIPTKLDIEKIFKCRLSDTDWIRIRLGEKLSSQGKYITYKLTEYSK